MTLHPQARGLLDLEQMRWFLDCYGRSGTALEDPGISPLRAAVLDDGRAAVAESGAALRAAFGTL
jgi:hypothetical protein